MSVRIIKNCLLFMLSLSWICWYMVQAHRLGSPPHIVFIVADDLGWNDVSWHNPDIVTPNLERLARDGIILNQSYVQPLCTPSRTAFMTGYFPFHVGRQNHVLHSLEPTGIPLKFTLLPEKLREYGYSSHAIGKWHLGYCNWSYTPTYRGFDSFFGFYSGSEDHFTHTRGHKDFLYFNEGTEWQWLNSNIGLDFRQGTSPATNYSGKYSTHVFARIMTNLLSTLDPSVPHFFYLPFQAVHSPLQVPKKYMRFYENIRDKSRRKFSGMVTALDEAVGKIVANLKKYGFYRNSVIVFVTDNGGQVQSGGNNWPLRGNKGTLWEGGTRGPAFVHSRLLEEKGYVSNKLVHAVDWYPTFIDIAGGQPDMTVDGVSQWTTLRTNGPEVRNEFVYNIFDTGRKPLKGAIRVGNFKLIKGFPGNPSGWIPPPSVHFTHEPTQHCYVRRNGNEQEIRLFNIQGWNDVSWNNPDIKMPNLERLARDGVILNQSYVQPVCSPSRTAFMTGYFPYHVGRQNTFIHRLQPSGVYLNYTFLPEKLKQLGYSTHIIGKWHLGYCNWSYTPTFRGFDSFFGFYLGAEEYYTHRTGYARQKFLDLRNNTEPASEYDGVYSTNLFATVTTKLISRLNPSIPTFLYLPFQAVHSPLQVPQRYLDMYKNVEDMNRRKYCGMISALDEAVGNITTALKKYGFYSNSVIGFTTDNGGQVRFGGNNWPLRGNKGTLWEGGTRGPAFVHSPLLNRMGVVTNNLFHAVDWLPTFLHLARGHPDPGIDGINQWNMINGQGAPYRREFVYNIYDTKTSKTRGAIRVGDYKLILGSGGYPSGWFPPPTTKLMNIRNANTEESLLEDDIYLFNIRSDPTERQNLATSNPHIAEKLKRRLFQLKGTMIPADDPPRDPKGNPRYWNKVFSPGWCRARG